ncbi:MAG: VanZ family protein [Nocardioidaceae bacterium]
MRYVALGPLVVLVLAVLAVAASVAVPSLRRGDLAGGFRRAGRVLLAGAVLAVLGLTLLGNTSGFRSVNLVPGAGIESALSNANRGLGILNLLGNVLMFAPIGFLFVVVVRRSIGQAVAVVAALSLFIETAQYVVGRAADIDDVLLNTTGALVGATFAVLCAQTVQAADRSSRRSEASSR